TPDFRLVGIVSNGIGCGWPGFPGIYTRAFENTINTFLNSHPHQAPIQTTLATLPGTPAPGQTLTCSPGTWLGNPDFTYSFGSAVSNSVFVPGSVTPPPTTTTTTTTSPPPQDTTPPTSTVKYARCKGTRCVLNVQVNDPPYTAGLGTLSVKARVAEIVRCRRA